MSWETELYVVRQKMPKDKKYDKSLRLEDIKEYLEIRSSEKSYENYIKPGILYFTEDLGALARELGVDRIVPKGLYIMGIYGGEKKRGREEQAGLALLEHAVERNVFKFKLYNTRDLLVVPIDFLKKYGIKIYKMIYVGEINPFRINKYLNIILSERGEKSPKKQAENLLKEFLEEALKLNERSISVETCNRVRKLINELKQPAVVKPLDMNKYYVIYRCDRAFTSSICKPVDNAIVDSHVAYVECRDESVAYYYVAVLNYLAYIVVSTGRAFVRHQFARPLLAAYIAGLSWNSVDAETREKIVALSRVLHEKSPSREYANQRVALKETARLSEFKEIVETLNSKVDREGLEEALNVVSGKGVEE